MRMQTAAIAAAFFSLAAVHAKEITTVTPIAAVAVESEVSGEVTVVNTESRMLTIRKDDGVFEILHAPPEVKRLDEIKIGERLTLTQSTSTVVALEQGRDAGSMGAIAKTEVQRASGSVPAGTISDKVVLYGEILGVDTSAGTVTVMDTNGTGTYQVADKSLLTKLHVKKGDGVIVTTRNEISGQIKR